MLLSKDSRCSRLGMLVAGASCLLLTGCGAILAHLFPAPSPPPPPPVESVAVRLVAEGLTSPVALVEPNDGTRRLFVVDQVGAIYVIDPGGNRLSPPFLDLRQRIVELSTRFDERGLLSLAFHPDYAVNGRFFVFYNVPLRPGDPEAFNSVVRISEFRVSQADLNRADPNSERILLEVVKPQFNHNGGQIAFGPMGKYLFIGFGDGGGANDVGPGHTPDLGNGQDKSTLLGKILRIGVDPTDGLPYGIPADNPFVGEPGARPEIWAFGLRNPYRFSFDTGGSRRLFLGDAGQDLFEEVDLIVGGGNYGWNIKEGSNCFDPNNPGAPPAQCPGVGAGGEPLIDPIIEYPHFDEQAQAIGIVVIGGFVYRGNAIPGLGGHYVFGDFSTGFTTPDGSLFAAEEMTDGTWVRRELRIAGMPTGRLDRFVLGFGQDLAGEVYVFVTQNLAPVGTTGRVYKIVPAS